MTGYILKRLGQSCIVIILVSLFAFSLVYLMPGDPVYALVGEGVELTEEEYQAEYIRLGLDRPVYERYADWVVDVLHGDLGNSTKYNEPVSALLFRRLPVTMFLGGISLVISTVIGIFFGMVASTKRGTVWDMIVTVFSNFGAAVPLFWLAVVGIYIFSVNLRWLPSFGFSFPWEGDPAASLKQLVLPVLAMSVGTISSTTRQTRSSMLEVIGLDYIRAARAKGVKEGNVIRRHALPNALIPVVTLIGMNFRHLVAGSVASEKVFNIPGMGQLLTTAVFGRDVAVTQACILIIAIVVSVANLVVDISYGIIDPRIRVQ